MEIIKQREKPYTPPDADYKFIKACSPSKGFIGWVKMYYISKDKVVPPGSIQNDDI